METNEWLVYYWGLVNLYCTVTKLFTTAFPVHNTYWVWMVFKKWNAPGHVILGKCDEARREAESLLSPRNGLFSNSNMAQRLANHSHIYWRYCVTEFAYCDLIGLYVFMMQQHLITYSVLAPITCFIYFRLTLRHSRDERCLHVLHRWCSYPFPTIVKKKCVRGLIRDR